MNAEETTYQGAPIVFDDDSQPECQLCHQNGPLPYVIEEGLSVDDREVVLRICQSCRDALMNVVASQDRYDAEDIDNMRAGDELDTLNAITPEQQQGAAK